MTESLLLLDLDGVVVFEAEPPLVAMTELILLHEQLNYRLIALGMPVVVLTHRSRREAQRILQAAGIAPATLAAVIAAEDLFIAGVRHAPLRMLKHGLRKDLALAVLERRFGVDRSRIAVIDDRIDNLQDLRTAGVGLTIHVPSYSSTDQRLLMTFELADALTAVRSWGGSRPVAQTISLTPRPLAMSHRHRTALSTTPQRFHAFNLARRVGSIMRLVLHGRSL
jgi:hypothetical protein